MLLADVIVITAFAFVFYGCVSKTVQPITNPVTDPNVIVLTRAEVAIVQAVNAKFKQVDGRLDTIDKRLALSDPNR